MSMYEDDVRRAVNDMRQVIKEDFSGYGWIKVPKYKMDQEKTWEERYQELEQHHIAETTFLIAKVKELAAELRQAYSPAVGQK